MTLVAEAVTVGCQMKATFFLPAHPSYFNNEFTQAEIDAGFADLEREYSSIIAHGYPRARALETFAPLRTTGKAVVVVIRSGLKVKRKWRRQSAVKIEKFYLSESVIRLNDFLRNLKRCIQARHKAALTKGNSQAQPI